MKKMSKFSEKFGGKKIIIGMIHLKPLPGSPEYQGDLEAVYKAALEDLIALQDGGVDGAIIENFGDVPYDTKNELIGIAAMSSIAGRLRQVSKIPLGVNVQFNDVEAEWAVSYTADCDFIRVEAFVENRVGVHGVTYAAAPEVGRLRGRYPKDTMVFADINTKHTFPLADQPMDFSIHEAKESGAEALIVTGILTGQNPTLEQVKSFKEMAGDFPVILGSGVNKDNVNDFFEIADGAIVGSSLKYGGNVFNQVDPEKVKEFMAAVK